MTERAVRQGAFSRPASAPDPSSGLGRLRRLLAADRALVALVVAVAAMGGALAAIAPVVVLALLAGVIVVGGLLALGARAPGVALGILAACLVGYALFGRPFAYVGVYPFYVGEALLGMCALVALMRLGRARFRAIHVVMLAFMALGLARTLPYVGTYGFDALRDGVTWLYCLFAFAVSMLVRPHHVRRLVGWFGWIIPLFLVWMPIAAVLARADNLPLVPGTTVPIINFKPGDAAVHLAGMAAFVLSGLYASTPAARRIPETVFWVAWLVCAGVVAALNRGGMLAMMMAASVALIVRPSGRWVRAGAIALSAFVALALINPTVDLGASRIVSFNQLTSNALSILGADSDSDELDGTRRWRILWWSEIVDYTVGGPYFWTGKGFGINLANADGFQVNIDESLRAPHNAHIEILAREGVPGLLLWVVLQASWLAMILRAGWRATRQPGGTFWARVAAWTLAYWAAAIVNMTFDVYLQGPSGGIWFWAIFGLGIAVAAAVEARAGDPASDPEPADPRSAHPAPAPSSGINAEPSNRLAVAERDPRRAGVAYPALAHRRDGTPPGRRAPWRT